MRMIQEPLRRACLIVASRPLRAVVSVIAVLVTTVSATEKEALAQGLGTSSFRNWLLDNIVPAALLVVAVLLIWLGGGRGENSQVMRRVLGVLVALAVVGLAITGAGKDIGTWLANLFRA